MLRHAYALLTADPPWDLGAPIVRPHHSIMSVVNSKSLRGWQTTSGRRIYWTNGESSNNGLRALIESPMHDNCATCKDGDAGGSGPYNAAALVLGIFALVLTGIYITLHKRPS